FSHTRPTPQREFSFIYRAPTPTEIDTLSLHDALPISARVELRRRLRHPLVGRARGARRLPRRSDAADRRARAPRVARHGAGAAADRKSTRLNSSHVKISYAVFCLKKKTYI